MTRARGDVETCSVAMLTQTAESVGIDPEPFGERVESDVKHEEVLAMYQDGVDRGVTDTPTFLTINSSPPQRRAMIVWSNGSTTRSMKHPVSD